MTTITISGANRLPTVTAFREGCRGIAVRDGMLLITHERRADQWRIPGGRLEPGETPAECCARELLEETGYIVRPDVQFLTLHELYEDWRFTSHYFLCTLLGTGEKQLTESEIQRGLTPEWIPLGEALAIFAAHRDYADTDEEKRGIYLAQYTALREYLRYTEENN